MLALVGLANRHREPAPPAVEPSEIQAGATRATLFVLVHGLRGSGPKTWADVAPALKPHGDVIMLNYNANPPSNADPVELARAISSQIGPAYASGNYERIVLVGHSIGSLLARKAYLLSAMAPQSPGSMRPWAEAVERIVLLAGMNRGWDVTGKRPLDMGWLHRAYFFVGAWFGRLTGSGRLVLGVEAGAPFVSNLRLEWMRWFAAGPQRTPLVVQLLGDIDDVVSDDDNKDLRAAASKNFFWLRVRGTALQQYESLKVDRVIFGGSVVRADYDWARIFSRGRSSGSACESPSRRASSPGCRYCSISRSYSRYSSLPEQPFESVRSFL